MTSATMLRVEVKDYRPKYTLAEAELAAKMQEMDPYHRDLMWFLINRIKMYEGEKPVGPVAS